MDTRDIVRDITSTYDKIRTAEEEYEQKKILLEKELEDKKSNILSHLGFRIGDPVTLEIFEYRDDRVHCFAVAQTAECFIHGVNLKTDEKGENFLAPILKKKDKKKSIYHNDYLSWDLKKDGNVILSHRAEQYIIPKTYTEEKIESLRKYLSSAQKI